MSGQRIAILCCAAAGLIATFLPWVHIPIVGAIPGTKGDGWITFALYLPAFILALSGNRSYSLSNKARLGAIIPALIASGIGVIKILDFQASMSGSKNAFAKILSKAVSVGEGLYLVIIAGLLMTVLSFSMNSSKPKKVIRRTNPAIKSRTENYSDENSTLATSDVD